MNLEDKVNQPMRAISMYSAPLTVRKQEVKVAFQTLLATQAERTLCTSPEIECINAGTSGSERENSGFSV
tara:strand:+ start:30299 stop:30508 length:210 start_codon:yes stop_codon:yes gene_type:complete